MAGAVSLDSLIASLTSAVATAQDAVHRQQLALIGSYFDAEGRPLSFQMRLPSTASTAATHDYRQVALPLVALVEPNMLAISEFSIDCTVQLDTLIASIAARGAAPAADTGSPTPPSAARRWQGAPVDVPAIGDTAEAAAAPARAAGASDTPSAAPAVLGPPPAAMNVSLAAPADSKGPVARMSIKVHARPPAEALQRLLTALNQTI